MQADMQDYLQQRKTILAALAREEQRVERLTVLSHLEHQARQLGVHAVIPASDDPLERTDSKDRDDTDSPV